jgi:uncharacterized membrane protein (DUF485 family)
MESVRAVIFNIMTHSPPGTNLYSKSDLEGDNTTVDLTYTYVMDKWSCMRGAYYLHVYCCFIMFLAGCACFATRLIDSYKWTHLYFGRLYVIAMFMATVFATLIHNSGLSLGVLVSFIFVTTGMVLGWIVIRFHQTKLERDAYDMVEKKLANSELMPGDDIASAVAQAKGYIVKNKTFKERLLSPKALHGILMLMSWANTAPRVFLTLFTGFADFTCYTQPVYKQVNTDVYRTAGMSLEGGDLMYVPINDPEFLSTPWGGKEGMWAFQLGVGPIAVGLLIGLIWSGVADRMERDKDMDAPTEEQSNADVPEEERSIGDMNRAMESISSTAAADKEVEDESKAAATSIGG